MVNQKGNFFERLGITSAFLPFAICYHPRPFATRTNFRSHRQRFSCRNFYSNAGSALKKIMIQWMEHPMPAFILSGKD
jgi:hypothetical protein